MSLLITLRCCRFQQQVMLSFETKKLNIKYPMNMMTITPNEYSQT